MSREMKDSGIEWIGEIPEEWNIIKAKFCGTLSANGVDKKIVENEKLFKSVHYMDVYRNSLKEIYNSEYYLVISATESKATNCELKAGDVLFTSSSETPEDIGHSTVVGENLENTLMGYHLMRFRPKFDFDYHYEKYVFGSHLIRKWFEYRAYGMTRYGLSSIDFKEARIIYAPLREQIKIANYLDSKCNLIDQTIEKQKQVIEKLKEYKQSAITEAVTKGLNLNVPMKDSGIEWIGEIPKHWENCKLKNIGRVQGRIGFKGYTISDIVDENEKGRSIVLGGTNIMKEGYISYDKLTYLSEKKYNESPEIMLYGGEILITKVGAGTGENALYMSIGEQTTINPNVMLFICNNLDMASYVNYYLLSSYVKKDMSLESNKSGAQPAINQEYVRNIFFVKPSLDEQKQIVGYLNIKCSKIDLAVKSKLQLIEKLELYKKSLIYEYVTGKREVL